MRKKNFKGRCEKRKLSKCEDVCRTFDAIQYAYADLLNGSGDIKSFRVNVLLDGMEGDYTSDFVCVKADYDLMVRECVGMCGEKASYKTIDYETVASIKRFLAKAWCIRLGDCD